MATCQDIIRRAMRAMGVLQGGQQPAGADAADGMERLQSLFLDLPGLLKNAVWREVAVSSAYTACEGDRITVAAPGTVTLPATITWGSCTRPPHDLAKVQIIGADATNAGLWLYSATKAAWGRVDGLEPADTIPFGDEDVGGLAAMLAVDLADEFGPTAAVQPNTAALAQRAVRSFRARLKKHDTYLREHMHSHSSPGVCDY